jgi:putative MFS transporter
MNTPTKPLDRKIIFLIIVAALGYFVDIYDLVLFGVVKAESLTSIMQGADEQSIAATGKFLFNMQMLGMLLGGILWGILGDKRGRLKVLFGSILLYSVANLLNAFVTDVPTYAVIRVIGITLVSEMMSKEKRGYGTMIIVTFGALGAVVASLVGSEGAWIAAGIERVFGLALHNWQVAYVVGGSMGILLLFLRIGTLESSYFHQMQEDKNISKGNLKLIFFQKSNLIKYIHCVVIGIPIWYVIGLLIMNSKDNFGPWLGVYDISNGKAVMYAYIGLSVGDLISGILSQVLKSRKKVVQLYLGFSLVCVLIFLLMHDYNITESTYYFMCFLLGTGTGYWAIFVTIAAEQFGTNIRSTAANTIPNLVRGSVNIVVLFFGILVSTGINDGWSALIVGVLFISLAFFSISRLTETFGKDLNYFDETL